MSATFSPPVRFSRLLLKVNAFLLLALLLIAAFLGLVAYKQGWFVPQTPVYFVTANALGINKGMPVKLYGFTVGSVSDMQLSPEGVEVQLLIMSEHLARMPRGSRAKLSRESGVVGASAIEIIPGKGTAPLAQGERLDFEPSRGISEIIDDFRRQAVPAFNEMKQVLSQLSRSSDDVTASFAGLRREIEQLPQTHAAVRKLTQDARKTLQAAEGAAVSVEHAVPMLAGRLTGTLDKLDAATGQLQRAGEEAQDTLQRVRPVIDRGESAAREAGEVFSAAKRVWPLSDSFKEASDKILPIDSFDASPR
jgi:phospholipid/cholesterol/gamma-HCH transport system substrate-binding protein